MDDEDAAYEAHVAEQLARMCPEVRRMEEGFDDPMTTEHGAGDAVAYVITRHMARCDHPWCREMREL